MSAAPWTIEQTVIISRMYADHSNSKIAAEVSKVGPARTKYSVCCKAKSMGLEKRENSGQFKHGNRPNSVPVSQYRPEVLAIIARDGETTVLKLMEETGASKSGVRYVLRQLKLQKNIHLCNYIRSGRNGIQAIWKIGPGKNVRRPKQIDTPEPYIHIPQLIDHNKPQPIPRPQLGAWGLAWGNAGAAG
jgi:hypothetical protein